MSVALELENRAESPPTTNAAPPCHEAAPDEPDPGKAPSTAPTRLRAVQGPQQRRARRLPVVAAAQLCPGPSTRAGERCHETACRMHLPKAPMACTLAAIEAHGGPMTLEEIGKLMNVSRQRVEQVEKRALARPWIRRALADIAGAFVHGEPRYMTPEHDEAAVKVGSVDDERIRRVRARGLPPSSVAWWLGVSVARVQAVAPLTDAERARTEPRR